MDTRMAVDETLLDEAVEEADGKSPEEVIDMALKQFILRQRQLKALTGLGTIDFDPDWTPRKARGKA
jgi:hypothetical protein